MAYVEAMASGAVVIGAQGWGIDGILQDGVNGFLVAPGRVADLTAALTRALGPGTWERISRSGIATAQALTESRVADEYLSFLLSVADARYTTV